MHTPFRTHRLTHRRGEPGHLWDHILIRLINVSLQHQVLLEPVGINVREEGRRCPLASRQYFIQRCTSACASRLWEHAHDGPSTTTRTGKLQIFRVSTAEVMRSIRCTLRNPRGNQHHAQGF